MYYLCKDKEEFYRMLGVVKRGIESLKESELKDLEIINKIRKGNALWCMVFMGDGYEEKATISYLENKNLMEFKKNYYISGKLRMIGERRVSWGINRYNADHFWGILMSDNKELREYLIKNIDNIFPEGQSNKHKGQYSEAYLSKTTLLALKGDWEELKRRSEVFLNDIPKSMNKKVPDYEFFIGLAEGNIQKMKDALNYLLIPKNAKKAVYDMRRPSYFFQLQVVIYGKIASIHGYNLEIDCDIAPKELIEYAPLAPEEYRDPYEFMKEFDYTKSQEEWIKKYE